MQLFDGLFLISVCACPVPLLYCLAREIVRPGAGHGERRSRGCRVETSVTGRGGCSSHNDGDAPVDPHGHAFADVQPPQTPSWQHDGTDTFITAA